ncbi:hypothetical protein KB206_10635 [Microvirga sp. STS02]|uniref:hypothetical protein n=1 Tax=Hymenobacter negativus TaxID=2795026 RepID=UPI0018DEBCE8|nr:MULTISPECIES: hypothetical protein [Bacteria]MBH8569342.1 hypothetical protein [Hymenobacter negativus]MBR7209076.1 hypothetical protein [Microvirga sp. STS02]
MATPNAEQQLLADAILRHRPFSLATAIRQVLQLAGEYVPEEEAELLNTYVDSIAIDMVPDGFRYVSRNGVPLLGIGPMELFEQEGSPQLLTRCAVWYGAEALTEWIRRGSSAP